MNLQIFHKLKSSIPDKFIRLVFQTILKELKNKTSLLPQKLQINLIITTDKEIQKLNHKWRNKNKTTDLSYKTTSNILNIYIDAKLFNKEYDRCNLKDKVLK